MRRAERGQPVPVCDGSNCFVRRFVKKDSKAPHRKVRRFMITDKRHFAGVKAHDTRLRNQFDQLVRQLRATMRHGAAWTGRRNAEAAGEQLDAVSDWVHNFFGWEEKP